MPFSLDASILWICTWKIPALHQNYSIKWLYCLLDLVTFEFQTGLLYLMNKYRLPNISQRCNSWDISTRIRTPTQINLCIMIIVLRQSLKFAMSSSLMSSADWQNKMAVKRKMHKIFCFFAENEALWV